MNLGIGFFKKLIKVCNNAGIRPEDALLIMTIESGLNPNIVNKDGGASGLVQFMPFVLRNFKFDKKSYQNRSFKDLSGEEQLDFIEIHFKNLNKRKTIKNAVQLYIGNFFPVALTKADIIAGNPSAVIVEKNPTYQKYKSVSIDFENRSYNSNKGLDSDKDGKITYGDIQSKIAGAANSKVYKEALEMLKQARLSEGEPEVQQISEDKPMENVNQLTEIVKKYLQAQDLNNSYYDVLGSNIEDKTEYARIFSFALKKELGIDSTILRQNNKIQLKVASKFDISKFNEELNNQLNFDIQLKKSSNFGYKIATPDFINLQYQKQLLKRSNG